MVYYLNFHLKTDSKKKVNNIEFSPAILNVHLIKLMEIGRHLYQKNSENGAPSISTLDSYRRNMRTSAEGIQLDNIKLLAYKFDLYAKENPQLANSRHLCVLAFDEKVIAPGIQSKDIKTGCSPTGMGINSSILESITNYKYFEEDTLSQYDARADKNATPKVGMLILPIFLNSF